MSNAHETALPRVVFAYGTMEIDEAVQRAAMAAAAGRCYVIAGITSIPRRPPVRYGGWRFSLSRYGRPPVIVSTHRFKHFAEAQVERVYRASSERDLGDDAIFEVFIQELAAFGDQDASG